MRLGAPRIAPLADEELSEDQRTLLAPYDSGNGVLNIYRTLARNPEAARGFLGWGRYVLRQSSFDARLRELVILRIGWLCRSGYEWTQHARLARGLGLTDAEIERIKLGPEGAGWAPDERLVLQAADELHRDRFVSEPTWRALAERLSETHLMDLTYVAAHYTQVCMILNTFGIQVEAHQAMDESLRA
jgi:4-carboxymuconolactone decarboxylase